MLQPEEAPTLNGMIHVDEYIRKDGVQVDEYWRRAPGKGGGNDNSTNPIPTGTINGGEWSEPTDQIKKMKKQNGRMKEYLKILVSAIPDSKIRNTLQAAVEANNSYRDLINIDGEGQGDSKKSEEMRKIFEQAVKSIPNDKIQNVLVAMNNVIDSKLYPNETDGGIIDETPTTPPQDGGIVGDSTESTRKQQERMKEYAKILLQAVPNDKIKAALNAFIEADSFFKDIVTTGGDEDGDGKVDLPEGFKDLDDLFKEAVKLIPNKKIQNVLNAMNNINSSVFEPDDDDGGIIDEIPEDYPPQDGGIWGDPSDSMKKQSEKIEEYLGILLQAIPNEEIRAALQATIQAGDFLSNPEVIVDKDGQLQLPNGVSSLSGLLELAVKAIPSDKIRGVLEAMNNVINPDSENNNDNKNDDKKDENKDKDDKNKKDKEEDNDPLKYLLTAAVTGEFDKNVLISKSVDSFADSVMIDIPLDEQGKKNLEWFKKQNEQIQALFDAVTDLMPEDSFMSDAAKTISQFKKTMDMQLETMLDPEKMMEQQVTEIKQWLVDFTDFTGQIIRGDFEYIKWDEIGEKLHISQIAGMINPVAGMIATLAVDVAPKVVKLVEGINAGDKAEIIKNALGAFTNCMGVIGELKEVIGDKLAEMSKDVSAEVYNEATKSYGDLEKIQDAGYRYEKLVSAELIPEANKEALKLNDLSKEMMGEIKGAPTGFADKINDLPNLANTTVEGLEENKDNLSKMGEMDKIKEIDFDPEKALHIKAEKFKSLSAESNDFIGKYNKGEKVIGEPIGDWKVQDVQFDKTTNFKAVVYEKGNEVVVSLVGTDFKNIKDNAANIEMGLLGKNKQMEQANKFCQEIKNTYRDKQITIIGHSEGGSEAIFAGAHNNLPVITYNAYGVTDKVLPQGYNAENIKNYRMPNDIVSKLRKIPGDDYFVKSDQSLIKSHTPLGWKESHQIKKMGDIINSIPEAEYDRENPSFINIKNLKKIQPELLEKFNLKSHKRALDIMEANHVFSYNLSDEELFNIYARFVLT